LRFESTAAVLAEDLLPLWVGFIEQTPNPNLIKRIQESGGVVPVVDQCHIEGTELTDWFVIQIQEVQPWSQKHHR
tara:strand:- start:26 stop:250 length:225 start_codon:yes stop_codon:yes gene_type:complete